MGGPVYAVTSGKGGVGKTTSTVSLAVALRRRGHSVAVLDADLGMPNVASTLDVEPDVTLHDLLAAAADTEGAALDTDDAGGSGAIDEREVAGAVVELADGLGILAGDTTLEGYAEAAPTGLETVVDALAERYDCVLLDTGGGLSYEGVLPLELCDEAILVTSPDPAAVGDTAKSKELADRLAAPLAGVVVTRVTDGDDPGELAGRLGVDLLGAIPFDPAVTESATAGVPLAAHAPDGEAAAAYDRVADVLSGDLEVSHDPAGGAASSASSGGPVASSDRANTEIAGASRSPDTVPGLGSGSADADDGEGSVVADGDGDAPPAGGVLSRLSGLLR